MSGLRERNKQEKLRRIQQAAWHLFMQQGFEATTTRQVAALAQVGSGTLFLYAKDKQDLLLLAYNEMLEETIEQAFRLLPPEGNVLDTLVCLFQSFFRLYQQHPENARVYVQVVALQAQAQRYREQALQQIERFGQQLAELLTQFQHKGALAPDVSVEQASKNFFALYFAILCQWLSGQLSFEEAQGAALRQAFALQLRGMEPQGEKR
uniref:HTH tetR-type domain-containing protein n=1 Tax=Thermosporothrix sp. COM3 TaxID=2490863 RepID=A0A455SCZ5_9CHLR|nr:hypothetical protein KTC_10740 [Thermosporothrix sp. COM3]